MPGRYADLAESLRLAILLDVMRHLAVRRMQEQARYDREFAEIVSNYS